MDVASLHEIYYLILEAADRDFEFWMTASFALIVASYFIAAKLNFFLLAVLLTGYTIMSVGMFVRWGILLGRMGEVRQMLEQSALEISLDGAAFAGSLTILTWGFGYLATIGYLVYSYSRNDDT